MDKFTVMAAALQESIGGRTRYFVVDYRDNQNNYFHKPASLLQPPGVEISPDEVRAGLIDPLEAEGYTVLVAVELLEGYTAEQLEALSKRGPFGASKHIEIIYYDAGKEGA